MDQTPALTRGLKTLEILSSNKEMSLESLAQQLQVPKSSMLRIMDTLKRLQYVSRDEVTKKYTTNVIVQQISPFYSSLSDKIQQLMIKVTNTFKVTSEWYAPGPEGVKIILREEPVDAVVHVCAQLGFFRKKDVELEAVTRIAYKSNYYSWSPALVFKSYNNGSRIVLANEKAYRLVQAVGDDWMTVDEEYNSNGIRRLAVGVRDPQNKLFGIMALAESYTPNRKKELTAKLAALKDTANSIEKSLQTT